jgi:hypothetical protein
MAFYICISRIFAGIFKTWTIGLDSRANPSEMAHKRRLLTRNIPEYVRYLHNYSTVSYLQYEEKDNWHFHAPAGGNCSIAVRSTCSCRRDVPLYRNMSSNVSISHFKYILEVKIG